MRLWILGILGITLVGVLACNVGGLSEEEVDSLSATAVARALTAAPPPTPNIPATITAAVEATMVALPTATPAPVPTPEVIVIEKEVVVVKEVIKEVEVVKVVEVVVIDTQAPRPAARVMPTPEPTVAPRPAARTMPTPTPALVSSRIQANGKDLQITDVKTAALSTAVVDWNNDGKKDLLLGTYWPPYIYLYLNSGTNDSPVFSMGERLQVAGRDLRGSMGANPIVTDWNNDGKKDIVLGGWNGIWVFLNGGTDDHPELQAGFPILSKSTGNNVGLGIYSHPFIVDWDNDGRKDLLNGQGRYLALWLNSGTDDSPSFSESTRLKFGGLEISGSYAPNVVDFDGDGRKDLVVRDSRGFYWYRNVGANSAPIFATKVAIKSSGTQLAIYGGGGSALFSIVDWDDDGVNDLIAGDYNGYVHVVLGLVAE